MLGEFGERRLGAIDQQWVASNELCDQPVHDQLRGIIDDFLIETRMYDPMLQLHGTECSLVMPFTNLNNSGIGVFPIEPQMCEADPFDDSPLGRQHLRSAAIPHFIPAMPCLDRLVSWCLGQ